MIIRNQKVQDSDVRIQESLEGGKLKTVEDLLAAKGEKIKKGRVNFEGDIEIEGE